MAGAPFAAKIFLFDAAAAACEVTDVPRLSRYHFKDVLCLQVGARLVLYFQSNKSGTDMVLMFSRRPYDGWPVAAANLQSQSGEVEALVTLAGNNTTF